MGIDRLLQGQSDEDAQQILEAAENMDDVLAEYAGDDGNFSPEE